MRWGKAMQILRHMRFVIIIGLGLCSDSYATIHRETTLEMIATPMGADTESNTSVKNHLTMGTTRDIASVDFSFDYGVFQESRWFIEKACHATTSEQSSVNMLAG